MADWWLSSNRTGVQALVSACHNVAPIHQGQCLLREDHDAEQIQLADCWGKWESARWLSFMISVWVIPLLNGFFFSSFKQTMMFVECRYRNGKVASLHNCCTERETSVLLFINTAEEKQLWEAVIMWKSKISVCTVPFRYQLCKLYYH